MQKNYLNVIKYPELTHLLTTYLFVRQLTKYKKKMATLPSSNKKIFIMFE